MFPLDTPILVVDDMSAMRMRVTNQLASFGYTKIFEAGNGLEALQMIEKLQSENNPIKLVVSDWNMPEMTGIDFLIKIRSSLEYKTLPFLMVTAEGEKEQVIKAIKNGVSDYLIKPVDKVSLKLKLDSIWSKINQK